MIAEAFERVVATLLTACGRGMKLNLKTEQVTSVRMCLLDQYSLQLTKVSQSFTNGQERNEIKVEE